MTPIVFKNGIFSLQNIKELFYTTGTVNERINKRADYLNFLGFMRSHTKSKPTFIQNGTNITETYHL